MNFKKILSAFDAISNPVTLTEAAEKSNKPWTDKSGKEQSGTAVTGGKYTGKDAEKEDKKKDKEVSEDRNAVMDSMRRMAGLGEATKPDADGDGVPDWADKTPGTDDEEDTDKEEVEESFMDKVKAGAKAVGKAITGPDDEELLQRLEKETGGKRPEKKDPEEVKESEYAAMRRLAGIKESQFSECGMDGITSITSDEDTEGVMSVNSNSSSDGKKSVSITASGNQADQLLQMLKLAGMHGAQDIAPSQEMQAEPEHSGELTVELVPLAHAAGGYKGPEEVEEADEEYANEPHPQVQSVDTQLRQGNDLNREKGMHKHSYRQGDNPMAMREAAELEQLEKDLFEELDTIKLFKEGETKQTSTGRIHKGTYGNSYNAADSSDQAGSTSRGMKPDWSAFTKPVKTTAVLPTTRHKIDQKSKTKEVDEATKETPTGRMHKGTYGNSYNPGKDTGQTGGTSKTMKPDWSAFTKPVKTTAVLPTTRHKMDKKG